MNRVVVRAPAKLNLALAVTGLTDGGYHLVDMIMQAVDVWETVEVVKSMGYSLRLPNSLIPATDKNTATKAAKIFFEQTGLLAGADITIHKKVPTRAGMAGGSADAAAVLVGLNELYGARLSLDEMCEMGVQVGADVPFSLLGGTARVFGIGEKMTALDAIPECYFAIAMPKGGVSTPLAYKRFDEMGSPFTPDIEAACDAIKAGSLKALCIHMQNMLEPSNGDDTTVALRKIMDDEGAIASMMTGSGAAVFGMFETKNQAEIAAQKAKNIAVEVFVAQPVSTGPQIVEMT